MRLGAEGRDELDPAGPEAQVDGLDALFRQATTHLDLGPKQQAIRLDRCVEVLDGEGDVMHGAHVHATDPND
jgi:hypothetical protein